MRAELSKALLISLCIIAIIGLLCMEANAQGYAWPAAIADPFTSIFAGFAIPPTLGGVFGVTSLFGFPGSFSYPSYGYYDPFDFDDYWYGLSPFLYDYSYDYSYSPWSWDLPYFGVTSAFFPIYTEAPWWASALAFL